MMAGLGPGVLVQNAWPSAGVVRTPGRSWKILEVEQLTMALLYVTTALS